MPRQRGPRSAERREARELKGVLRRKALADQQVVDTEADTEPEEVKALVTMEALEARLQLLEQALQ
eukprot:3418498-Amphidinium_carterae.1